jgi:hypothetical protein
LEQKTLRLLSRCTILPHARQANFSARLAQHALLQNFEEAAR